MSKITRIEDIDIDFRGDMTSVGPDAPLALGRVDEFVANPKLKWVDLLETINVAITFFTCILVPFMASFNSQVIVLWVIVYILDVFYILYVIGRFFLGYITEDGIIVLNKKLIRRRYLRSTFAIDVLSILPTDILAVIVPYPSAWKLLTMVRMNRLLRFHYINQYFDNREAELGTNTALLRSIKYAIYSFLTTHLAACCWFSLSCEGYHDGLVDNCRSDTWGSHYELDLNYASSGDAYLISCYWAIATVTSTGYGDISATSTAERWYATGAMLIGIAVFFGMLLGGMTSMLTNFGQTRAIYVHRFKTIKEHLDDYEVDIDLQDQVIGYYEYLWVRKKGVLSEGIYDILPLTFQAELAHTTNSCILEKAPLFSSLGTGFLRMLSLIIKPMLFLPNQIILTKGDIGHQMYFIHKGEVEVLSEEDDATPVATLKSGKLFGEVSLIYSLPRTATIRAKSHCDLMVLDKHDLQEMLIHYPEVTKRIQDVAKERCLVAENIGDPQHDFNPHFKAYKPRSQTHVESFHSRRRSFVSSTDDCSSCHAALHHHKHRNTVAVSDSVEVVQTDEDELEALHDFVTLKQGKSLEYYTAHFCRLVRWVKDTTINPNSTAYRVWEKVVISTCVFICFLYPYLACFRSNHKRDGYFDTPVGLGIMGFSYLLDLVFIVDIFVSLRTEVVTPHGTLDGFTDIFNSYGKSSSFTFDIASVLPIEIMCLLETNTHSRNRLFAILKVNRVIKFLKVPMMFGQLEQKLTVSVLKIRLVKFLLYITLLSHWVACVLYAVACYGPDCGDHTWMKKWPADKGLSANDTDVVAEYVVSLYWAAATMTSTGYGDIVAHTLPERLTALAAMVIGLLLYGYCLSSLAATLANMESPKVQFQERLFAVKAFMKERHLGMKLKDRVRKYLIMLWEKHKGVWIPGSQRLMHDMPLSLQQDISIEDALKTLTRCPLFTDTDENFLRSLSLKTQSYLFSPGDVIVYAGDMGREMYCIRRGRCQVVSPDMTVITAELGPGGYFGEIGMLFGDYRTASIRAKTHVEVLELKMSDLLEVLKGFPLIETQMKSVQDNRALLERLQRMTRYRFACKTGSKKMSFKSMVEESAKRMMEDDKQPGSVMAEDPLDSHKQRDANYERDMEQTARGLGACFRCLSKLLLKKTFLPSGKVVSYWTICMVTLTIIQAFTIPLQAAFMQGEITLWVLHYVMDLFSYVNIYICMHIAFYNDNNILVTHPLYTTRQYLRTNFLLDLLTVMPFEVIAFALYQTFTVVDLHLYALSRWNRVLNIYRLPLMFRYFESAIDKETGIVMKLKFSLYTGMFLHWITCSLFTMACPPAVTRVVPEEFLDTPTGHHCLGDSWLAHTTNLTAAGALDTYMTSLYWATATALSVGYGEISAFTLTEMVVSLLIMIIGVLFFGFLVASVAAGLANADAARARFSEKLAGIKNFLQGHKVDSDLQQRVVRYYEYVYLRTKGIEPRNLFNGLPLSLWGDVTLSLYYDVISKISLFEGTEVSFIKMLSKCIKPLFFLKGEYIVRKHDIGSEMYFIHRGAVDVTNEEGTMVFDTMRAGQSFGEVALLFSCPRTASIRARTNSDVFVLHKQDLDVALEYYPAIKVQIMNIAEERRNQARKRSAAKINVEEQKDEEKEEPKQDETENGEGENRQTGKQEETLPDVEAALSGQETADDGASNRQADKQKETLPDVEAALSGQETADDGASNESLPRSSCVSGSPAPSLPTSPLPSEQSDPPTSPAQEPGSGAISPSSAAIAALSLDESNASNNAGNVNNNADKTEEGAVEPPPKPCWRRGWERFQELNRFTLKPNNQFVRHYLSVMAILGIVSSWLVIYELAFQSHGVLFHILVYMCDSLFLIEMFLKFHQCYYDAEGNLVEDFPSVWRQYLKTPTGFPMTVMASVPLEVFCFAAPEDMRQVVLSGLRINRALRLFRVFQFFNRLEKELDANMMVVRLGRSMVTLGSIIHFFSSAWFVVACPFGICSESSWVSAKGVESDGRLDVYCRCVYWCVATMTSTGYGDERATNLIEMLLCSIVMIAGKLVFGFILGSVASTLANAENQRVSYDQKLQAVKDNMVDQGVPKDQRKRVIEYFDYMWKRNKGIEASSLFQDTPFCLLAEITLGIYRDMLLTIPLFEGVEDSFLRQISLRVTELYFMPEDYIVRKGDVGREVYFIHSGSVEVLSEDTPPKVLDTLSAGNIFGEVNLLVSLPRRVTVRALTHVDLFFLTKDNLDSILTYFPVEEARVAESGERRFGQFLKELANQTLGE